MTKTQNYNLNQWDAADPVRRTDFNADNAAIDAALAANAKALNDYKTANDDAVGKKADTTALAALEQSVSALSTALGSGGQNCRIAWGSYTGTGTMQQSLNFDFYPVLILLGSSTYASSAGWPSIFLRSGSMAHSDSAKKTIYVTWSDTGVSWTGNDDDENQPGVYQNNVSGRIYRYCAIGYDAN